MQHAVVAMAAVTLAVMGAARIAHGQSENLDVPAFPWGSMSELVAGTTEVSSTKCGERDGTRIVVMGGDRGVWVFFVMEPPHPHRFVATMYSLVNPKRYAARYTYRGHSGPDGKLVVDQQAHAVAGELVCGWLVGHDGGAGGDRGGRRGGPTLEQYSWRGDTVGVDSFVAVSDQPPPFSTYEEAMRYVANMEMTLCRSGSQMVVFTLKKGDGLYVMMARNNFAVLFTVEEAESNAAQHAWFVRVSPDDHALIVEEQGPVSEMEKKYPRPCDFLDAKTVLQAPERRRNEPPTPTEPNTGQDRRI
jgi:hypothetical protein